MSSDKVLTRVQALLAKAESSEYDAEALSFTAKAQALMAEHSITEAMLDAASPGRTSVASTEVPLLAPYAIAKCKLLVAVAAVNCCYVVRGARYRGPIKISGSDHATVYGAPNDLRTVETLFTSLLVQAQAAMYRHHKSSQSFRRSFYFGFAVEVWHRLKAITDEMMAAKSETTGTDVVPVMDQRAAVAKDYAHEANPDMVTSAVTAPNDALGELAGRLAGAQADLARGRELYDTTGRNMT